MYLGDDSTKTEREGKIIFANIIDAIINLPVIIFLGGKVLAALNDYVK